MGVKMEIENIKMICECGKRLKYIGTQKNHYLFECDDCNKTKKIPKRCTFNMTKQNN